MKLGLEVLVNCLYLKTEAKRYMKCIIMHIVLMNSLVFSCQIYSSTVGFGVLELILILL